MFGKFSITDHEFIITRPDTPTPWMNYLSNREYCTLLSNTAGGFSFHIDPKDRRLTRYRYNSVPVDRPGKYIYIKNTETNESWSPTWQPVQTKLDDYECRVGFGYNKISSAFNQILAKLTFLVPINDNVELWKLSLRNNSSQPKDLVLFSYVEFALFNAVHDQWDLQYVQNIAVSKFENNFIFYSLFDFSTHSYVFFSCSEKIESYDCEREAFIGPYRSESNPIAIENGFCSNSEALGGNPIASTSFKVHLEPSKEKNIIFILGTAESKANAIAVQEKYNTSEIVDKELEIIKNCWLDKFSNFVSETPDQEFDNLVNGFNAYQCHMTFNWSRYVSFYETGIGRGMGFRDCCQDILGVCHSIPHRVRSRIIELLENQFIDGHVYHQFFPLTKTGGFPDYTKKGMEFFSDDHLWIILSVTMYLKESGDFKLLQQEVPFVDGPAQSVYEHLKRSINFSLMHLGKHGVPLMGSADWNDALQMPGLESESVWSGMLLHRALLELEELALQIEESADKNFFYTEAGKLKNTINSVCWDGEWYTRGYTHTGIPVGSKSSNEGIMFLNPQTWAVLAKIASPERANLILRKVNEKLATPFGIKLFDKPYTKYYPELGGISTFPPGLKENGAIFCHTNPWLVIAECLEGNGDKAYEYFSSYSPLSKIHNQIQHRAEPYIYSQMITGPDHQKFGQAKNSWLTGTAAWSYHALTNWILGIRPEYTGLLVDPCIPTSWENFTVTRIFRGTTYVLSISNPDHVSHGIKEVIVDNKPLKTNLLPVFCDANKHFVRIIMGC